MIGDSVSYADLIAICEIDQPSKFNCLHTNTSSKTTSLSHKTCHKFSVSVPDVN